MDLSSDSLSEVCCVSFFSKSGSDGLLKLWTIKTNECVKTLDGHEDKIWGLHSNKQDDMVVTASSDSCITLWKVQYGVFLCFLSGLEIRMQLESSGSQGLVLHCPNMTCTLLIFCTLKSSL